MEMQDDNLYDDEWNRALDHIDYEDDEDEDYRVQEYEPESDEADYIGSYNEAYDLGGGTRASNQQNGQDEQFDFEDDQNNTLKDAFMAAFFSGPSRSGGAFEQLRRDREALDIDWQSGEESENHDEDIREIVESLSFDNRKKRRRTGGRGEYRPTPEVASLLKRQITVMSRAKQQRL